MEPNETGLSAYYHQHQPSPTLTSPAAAHSNAAASANSPATNGLLPNHGSGSGEGSNAAALYPHSVAGKAPAAPVETVRRKRGRPRKYVTAEDAAAAKRAASSSNLSSPPPPKKKEQPFPGGSSSKKSQSPSSGNAGQGFTPHLINVAAGEDVSQRIMMFAQEARREVCVLSASGSVCNVSLRQPATSGGNVTYEGLFDIISLSGSYVRTDLGGRAGGLSACLLNLGKGTIIGGGVGGPLIAAGPVEVIVGSFLFDPKKDGAAGIQGNASTSLPSPVPTATVGYRPVIEPSGRFSGSGSDDHHNISGSPFMVQPQNMHMAPVRADWRDSLDTRNVDYDFTGRAGQESPENGDYDQMPD